MVLTRQNAESYLMTNYLTLATELGVNISSAGWEGVIDRSLRELGVAESGLQSATVDDTKLAPGGTITGSGMRDAWFALLDYFALVMFRQWAAVRVDVNLGDSGGTFGKQRSQIRAGIKELIDEARARAQAYGFIREGQAVEWGQMTLDWIEPIDPLLLGIG